MVLMPVSAPIKVLVLAAKMLSPELGGGHEATRVHHVSRRCGGGAAAAWPIAARAQQPERMVIGLLQIGTPSSYDLSGFRQGLKEAGYVEDQNLVIEYRFANDDPARLPELASDLTADKRVAFEGLDI
jgi:hypothetical protein